LTPPPHGLSPVFCTCDVFSRSSDDVSVPPIPLTDGVLICDPMIFRQRPFPSLIDRFNGLLRFLRTPHRLATLYQEWSRVPWRQSFFLSPPKRIIIVKIVRIEQETSLSRFAGWLCYVLLSSRLGTRRLFMDLFIGLTFFAPVVTVSVLVCPSPSRVDPLSFFIAPLESFH